mmetsp:Transcript_36483/g.58823  ORF Transcript_36483/g.58823 Transcript_36483/m.58823 type:complete len:322 (+) Transcript_36483:21-986(+)
MAAGSYQLGFQITPLLEHGGLDSSGDFKGGPHPVEDDPLFRLCTENRDGGNKLVQEGRHEEAVGRYSELIMQSRALENETDILWTEEGRIQVRQLRAAAYLNLSLCFLKLKQWTHAVNTATRAMQGDKDPADPKEDVLAPEKKAKALFRRAQAQRDGFAKMDEAVKDLKKAAEYAPEDKAVQQELRLTMLALKKSAEASDKKLAGFLNRDKKVQRGDGIFSDADRDRDTSGPQLPKEPVKVSDGLWVVPKGEEDEEKKATEDEIDFEELSREISEMKEERPEAFAELQVKMAAMMAEQAALPEVPEESAEGAESEPAPAAA